MKKVKDTSKKQKKKKRPPVNFEKCNIPMGAKLVYTEDPSIVVTVVSERKVQYGDEITSLSAIVEGIKGGSIQGTQYFTYKGKIVADIAEETQWKEIKIL